MIGLFQVRKKSYGLLALDHQAVLSKCQMIFNPRTSKGEGGSNGPPIGFSDLKFDALKQSK